MKYLAPTASLLLGFATSGCTLIGYGVGFVADQQAARIPTATADQVKAGEEVEVHLVDGTVLRGRFVSVERSFDDYQDRYDKARATAHEVILPPLGPVHLSGIDGHVTDGVVAGFDPDGVWLRTSGDGYLLRFGFDHVGAIRTDEGPWPAPRLLAERVRKGTIPAVSRLRLTTAPPLAPIPFERIAYLSHGVGSGGRLVGTLLGVTADVLAIKAARPLSGMD